ncbi:sterol desaturase family protein [Hymenobacter taeanensis]|uniref:Sterol desaturase family protein n=1 Tax=Hymenobacter taeanensis TaxID=2735321 RepID=A0A6M6BKN4_9BACT|nr:MULTISPECIES: sterol desaturase family protein [Hymenobacter]QJX48519.1 sterol desaturase family protein [Hymenobacter taeanensis]UOQ81983.1 sterol desaturase family protein [Hymenobacter sp. 5414T-23]
MPKQPSVASLLKRFDRWATPTLVAVGLALLVLETIRPLRRRTRPRTERWSRNLGLAAPSLVAMRFTLLPALAGLTYWATRRGFGLLLRLPPPLRITAELLVLDYVAYTWHRLLHAPVLWRLHRVHHIDLDMDLTTAWRFHFGEMLASIPYRAGLPALLGVRPGTVLAYEVAFEACTAFHHSNLRLPLNLERHVVKWLVTPRAHGIHHSVVHRETQSNFGVGLTLWDRLHHTLRLNVPQQQITIGTPAFPDADAQTIKDLLRLPLAPLRPWVRPDGTVPTRPEPISPLHQLAE